MEGSFEDRERQFEAKFAHDQDIKLKVHAHRDKLFAHWAADQLGDGAPPEYADTLLEFAFGRKPEDLIDKVLRDLHDHGVAVADTKVRRAFNMCTDQARDEVMKDIGSKP
jgi:hypothetical protein